MLCGSKWTSLAICGVTIAVVATEAHAQAPGRPTQAEAVKHFKQGNALWNLGEFEKAVAEYKAGALIEPAPVFLYNLAQCYRMLGKYQEAIWHYDRFLGSGTATPPQAAAIQKFIASMKAELEQRAKSEPPTEPAGMEPSSALPPPTTVAVPTPAPPPPWYHDAFGWGLTGAGMVAGGFAGVLFVDAASLRDDANKTPVQEEQNALHDKADTRALIGTILAVGGGALLVTGIVKLAIHDRAADSTETAWTVGLSPTGVFAVGRF